MKEEGRRPSKFSFLPPASPRPSDLGGVGGAGWILLACFWSTPGQHIMELPPELFSEARGISGNSLSPKRTETKQRLSLEIENRQQNSLDLFLNLLSWLISSQSCWQLPKVTPQSFAYFSCPLFGCVPGVSWGHGSYPVHLIRGGSQVR